MLFRSSCPAVAVDACNLLSPCIVRERLRGSIREHHVSRPPVGVVFEPNGVAPLIGNRRHLPVAVVAEVATITESIHRFDEVAERVVLERLRDGLRRTIRQLATFRLANPATVRVEMEAREVAERIRDRGILTSPVVGVLRLVTERVAGARGIAAGIQCVCRDGPGRINGARTWR